MTTTTTATSPTTKRAMAATASSHAAAALSSTSSHHQRLVRKLLHRTAQALTMKKNGSSDSSVLTATDAESLFGTSSSLSSSSHHHGFKSKNYKRLDHALHALDQVQQTHAVAVDDSNTLYAVNRLRKKESSSDNDNEDDDVASWHEDDNDGDDGFAGTTTTVQPKIQKQEPSNHNDSAELDFDWEPSHHGEDDEDDFASPRDPPGHHSSACWDAPDVSSSSCLTESYLVQANNQRHAAHQQFSSSLPEWGFASFAQDNDDDGKPEVEKAKQQRQIDDGIDAEFDALLQNRTESRTHRKEERRSSALRRQRSHRTGLSSRPRAVSLVVTGEDEIVNAKKKKKTTTTSSSPSKKRAATARRSRKDASTHRSSTRIKKRSEAAA